MARVDITVPDALMARARDAGLNVSQAAAAGIAEELDRGEETAALDGHLAEVDAERGPATAAESAQAAAWADEVFRPLGAMGAATAQHSA